MLNRNLLIEKIVLPLGDQLTKGSFMHQLNTLRKLLQGSEEALANYQTQKLDSLLQYASNNIVYYRNRVTKKQDQKITLQDFPILDKNLLAQHHEELLAMPKEQLIKNASSGSTGQQSIVYWSKEEQSINRATQILWWEWAGYRLGHPILQTGITPNRGMIKSIKDKLLNTYYIQAFTHTREEVIKALQWASQQKEPVLAGYASSLYVIAQFALEAKMTVKFKAAVCWGDKLFDHYRKTIQEAFGVEVKETYGSAEGLMMGAQKDLEYMYMMTPNVWIEIVNDQGQEVEDGTLGHVLVTNLNAKAMPLIRYRIGDLAIKLPKNQYPSKRELPLPLWQKVIGRDTDLVRTPSGKFLVVHSFTGVFEHLPQIKQFCVIQENLQEITIQYIPGNGFNEDLLRRANDQLQSYIQEPFQIQFQRVDTIPPTKSGKPQLIISHLDKISLHG